jgi:hypothetical protein
MDTDDIVWLANQLRIADDRERRHVESIHILITTAIIASYFTPTAQTLISSKGISRYTDALVGISVLYLSLRLVDITVPIRDLHTFLDWLFGFIAPLGFLTSVLGYLTVVFLTIYEIPATEALLSSVSLSIAIVSVLLSIYQIQYKKSRGTKSSTSLRETAIEFEDYIYENPELIEEGLTWHERDSIGAIRTDFTGTDQQGNTVYGEAKIGSIDRTRISQTILHIIDNIDSGRLLIITNSNPRSSAEDAIQSIEKNISKDISIEIKEVEFDTSVV